MCLVFCIAFLLTPSPPAEAQTGGAFPHFPWGARFVALGGGGGPADDAFAAVYNPAAVRGCGARQLGVHQMKPFDVPITGMAWCGGAGPAAAAAARADAAASGTGAIAAGAAGAGAAGGGDDADAAVGDAGFIVAEGSPGRWAWGGRVIVRQSPPGLGFDYNTYQIGLTAGYEQPLGRGRLTLGGTFKLLVVSIEGTGAMDETVPGYALDVGAGLDVPLAAGGAGPGAGGLPGGRVFQRLAIDAAAVDVISRLHYRSGVVEPGSAPVYRLAAALAGPRLTAGVTAHWRDGEASFGAGVELAVYQAPSPADVLQRAAVRGGFGPDGSAVGLGMVVGGFAVDYAYRLGEDQDAHVISTAVRF